MKTANLLLTCTFAATAIAAHADFTYQESTQITGGTIVGMMKMVGTFSKAARQIGDPILTTVMVKGNRMTRISKDSSEIIDLDKGTVTEIDNIKKQYTVMTFEEMRQRMEAAMAKAKSQQKSAPEQPASGAQDVSMKFNVHVKNTGTTKDIVGLSATESILTMNMEATDKKSGQSGNLAITNDMYLAPEIPGYEEVREFYKRYALKMGSVMGQSMNSAINPQLMAMMQQPAAGQGMADMAKEMAKLKGVPVLQIMRIGTTTDGTPLPAASEAALPAAAPTPTAGDIAKQSATSAISDKLGALGGFGGFGRKKKADPASEAAAATTTPTAAVLMESNTQLASFSKASVDPSQFNPPAGYKQVELKPID